MAAPKAVCKALALCFLGTAHDLDLAPPVAQLGMRRDVSRGESKI
jgi:hypothetical protein